mgnify:CR=1 FL=1
MLLQIPENFDDIAMDDIFYTVLEIVKGVKLSDFINFKKSQSDSYGRTKLFTCLLLSLAINRKLVLLRALEKEYKYDVRFRITLNY